MLSFARLFSAFTLLSSFALLSTARPMHRDTSLRVRDESNEIARFKKFQTDMTSATQSLSETAKTGENPQAQVKRVTSVLDAMSACLTTLTVKPTPKEEAQMSNIVSHMLISMSDASYEVAKKANFQKWYAYWTEEDVSLLSFFLPFAKWSFSAYKEALIKAGPTVCDKAHQMHMRHTANAFRGAGVYH